MPVITSAYPGKTVQQLHATLTDAVGRLGRVVVLTDEDYTVDERDDLIVLTSTTSVGDWTLTFPAGLPENHRVLVVMPAVPSGTDAYVTDGLVAEATFDAAGQTVTVLTAGGLSIVEGAGASALPPPVSSTIGNGVASPVLALTKPDTGTAAVELRVGPTVRGRFNLSATEVVTLTQHDAAGAVVGALTFDPTTGAITCLKGFTITAGGLVITAGNLTLAATSTIKGAGLFSYTDNAAALLGGLVAGDVYVDTDTNILTRVVP